MKSKQSVGTQAMAIPGESASWRKWCGPLLLLALLGLGFGLGLHRYLTFDAIAENRAILAKFTSDHFGLAVIGFIVIYALAVAISFPGASILTILAGLLFGWLVGGLAAIAAATMGATIVFQIARSSFGDVLANKAGPLLKRINEGFREDAFSYMLFLRLVPAFPFWLVNIAPALANVKLRTFVVSTFIGIIPATFAFATVGAGLDSVITTQLAARAQCLTTKQLAECPFQLSVSSLITPELLLSFAALGVVALIPVALKKWKARHEL